MTANNTDTLTSQALAALDAGDAATAAALYQQVLDTDPANHEACLMLGSLYGQTGRIEEAVQLLRSAVETDTSDVRAGLVLAHIYRATGDRAQAISTLEGLQAQTSDCELTYTLATLLEENDERDRAGQLFRDGSAQWPDSADARLALASFYMNGGEFEQAANTYREALQRNPALTDATGYLSIALCQLNRDDEAITLLHQAIDQNPDNADLHYFMAGTLTHQGQDSEALEHCDRALALAPGDPRHIVKKAEVLEGMGNLDQSFELLKPVLESGQFPVEAGLLFARLSHPLGMVDDGKTVLQRLAQQPLTPVHRNSVNNAIEWLNSV